MHFIGTWAFLRSSQPGQVIFFSLILQCKHHRPFPLLRVRSVYPLRHGILDKSHLLQNRMVGSSEEILLCRDRYGNLSLQFKDSVWFDSKQFAPSLSRCLVVEFLSRGHKQPYKGIVNLPTSLDMTNQSTRISCNLLVNRSQYLLFFFCRYSRFNVEFIPSRKIRFDGNYRLTLRIFSETQPLESLLVLGN